LNSLVRLPQWKGVISLFKFPAKMWRGESHGESNLVSLSATSTWNIWFLCLFCGTFQPQTVSLCPSLMSC
jgi:hypothetical protein